MAAQKPNKLNWLGRRLPEGLLVDAAWLERHGYSGSLRRHYVAGGWLEQPVRGVFRRPRGSISWEQVVISLQYLLHVPVSIGGRTALEHQGYAHYVPREQKRIHLYADGKLPGWLFKLPLEETFVRHNRCRFLPPVRMPRESADVSPLDDRLSLEHGLRPVPWGQWQWPLLVSTPERALLELLDELPSGETFHDVDVLFESLVDLSPRRLQRLLEQTRSIKVKRLFFFYADRHAHRWLARVDREKIDLGSGKRVLVRDGKLEPNYQITLPAELFDAGQ